MFITIAGTQGSGKSTVCKVLEKKYGLQHVKISHIMRKMAEEKNITILEMNQLAEIDPEIDKMIDQATIELSNEFLRANKHAIFDSRMAWHFVPNSIKVFITADERVRAERILNDGTRGSVENFDKIEETISSINSRMKSENERYKKYYGVDNLDMSNYDLILDSSNKSPDELAEEIVTYAKERDLWSV